MTNINRRKAIQQTMGLAGVLAMGNAFSQSSWPQKPIRIIVPNPAGGTADALPRLLAEPLSKALGQSVIIENRPGAAGNIAAEYIYNVEADGYTLFASPPPALAINANLYPKLNYQASQFVPITVLAAVPNALIVNPNLPFNTIPEFLSYLKSNPNKISFASQGSGSTAHLTGELFKLKTGLSMLHIPYKGDAPAITDLLAGHVDVMFGNIGATMQYIKSDKLKLIALTTPKRLKTLPNIPTINEFVPGMVASTWFAMVAPPKTPMAIVNKLSTAISTILKTPDMQKRLAELGAEAIGDSPEETAKWIKEDTERWKEVIQAGKITV